MFNPNIALSPYDWESLIGRHFRQDNHGCIMMRCVSLIPGHIIRGSRMFHEEPGLVSEARSNHQTLQASTLNSRQSLEHIQALFDAKQSGSTRYAHALCLRAHSINVAALIMLNRVLFAIDVTSSWNLSQEAERLSKEVLSLAKEAEQYAPLGSSHVTFCLCAAWMGFPDYDQRSLVESLLLDFYHQKETAMLVDVLRVKVQELEDLRTARSASLSAASPWLEFQDIERNPW
jgi:hypothetical protein